MKHGAIELTDVLRSWREQKGLDAKQAAARIGLPHTVYFRLERGENLGGETLATVLRWLLSSEGASR